MIKILPLILGLCFPYIFSQAQSSQAYFMTFPTLSPDGEEVVFSFQGDLWKVSSEGGQAYRLTAMAGEETRPSISPDGKWLAFSASPNGQMDIYVMPYAGGEIRQLTWHQGYDEVENWAWDGQSLYFCSNRENRFSSYKVDLSGGTPSRLFPHYFHTTHDITPHPDGRLFFNETWESKYAISRKGYVGPFNPDIKSYHPGREEFSTYTDFEGKDFGATIDRQGNVYFISTEHNGEYNLYQLSEGGKHKRLTNFSSSVKRPKVSANGERIVFEKDYQLSVWETQSRKTKALSIQIPLFDQLDQAVEFNVAGSISHFDVSPDNKKLAFVSRGELFVSDVKGKFVKHIATRSDGRVSEVCWLDDNRRVLFNQTVGGYQNWFMVYADSVAPEKALTQDRQNNRNLSINSDRTQAVYLSGRNEVRLMDLKNFSSNTLVKDELWGLYNPPPYFSPDDQYIVFTAYRNFEQDIFAYHLKDRKVLNLTQTGLTETSPFWSPDGKYLYFTADRRQPNYPYGPQDLNVYRLPLQNFNEPFRSDEYEKLFEEDSKEEKSDEKKEENEEEEKEKEEAKNEKSKVVIDTDRLLQRWEQIGPSFGMQASPYVIQKGDKTHVVFASNHSEGRSAIWVHTTEKFGDTKTEKIEGVGGSSFLMKKAKDTWYIHARGSIYTLNIGGADADKIDISYRFQRNLQDEFRQMFDEVWANVEENFYNETFHGIDWGAMREEYARYLPYIKSRSDLRQLIGDLLGELNTSHSGFYSNGREENTLYETTTQATGIVFSNKDPFTVERIVRGSRADKVGVDIQPGDKLTAVAGKSIDPTANRERYFSAPSSQSEFHLTFRRGDSTVEVKLHPQSYNSLNNLRYDEWEAACQERVDSLSGNRIAYVHMKNMTGGELRKFLIEMTAEGHQREGIILDLRYNTGGNVHDEVLRFLSQRPYLKWKYREGTFTPQSNFGPAVKPIVLLINEQSLSDAEMTANGFKELGLGTIIGRPTYRWIIFTSGKGLVDGSFYRLPSWGCYTLDGKNLEKTGVSPDIEVDNTFVDRLKGEDPQLEKALEVVMEALRNKEGK